MDSKEYLLGRKVKLIFKDEKKIFVKEGVVSDVSNNFVTLKRGEKEESLPISRIIRIEYINTHERGSRE